MRSDRGIASLKRGKIMIYDERFIKTRRQIWIDKISGINYLYSVYSGYSGGLTVLVDSNGEPIVTPPDEIKRIISQDW